MQEEIADLWDIYGENVFIGIPTNGIVKPNGELVMGAGVAADAAMRFPNLAYRYGQAVLLFGNVPYFDFESRTFSFPTKTHFKAPSPIGLIRSSAESLATVASTLRGEEYKFYMPRPGCGFGGLKWADVKWQIESVLPDNVIIVSKS